MSSTNNGLGFAAWMTTVNQYVLDRIGCWADDLPDYCYADAFEDGVSPKSAASRAIRAAREG